MKTKMVWEVTSFVIAPTERIPQKTPRPFKIGIRA